MDKRKKNSPIPRIEKGDTRIGSRRKLQMLKVKGIKEVEGNVGIVEL